MSNIIVRNVVGTGVFAIPTSEAELSNASNGFGSIINGIVDFTYKTCLAQIIDQGGSPQELTCVIDNIEYNGSWFTDQAATLKSELQNAMTNDPNINSIGDIAVNIIKPSPFYRYVPQIDRIDTIQGIVYFKNQIPEGAQIEVYRYSPGWRRKKHGTEDELLSIGKRWRPDQLLPIGSLQFQAGIYQRTDWRGRTHFRFAYRWPANPGSLAPAPGERGPLSAYAVSTAVRWEREQDEASKPCLLVITPSPSSYGYRVS